jgi:hypothetical protein
MGRTSTVVQPPPPLLYTAKTRPPPSQIIEFDEDAFHCLIDMEIKDQMRQPGWVKVELLICWLKLF